MFRRIEFLHTQGWLGGDRTEADEDGKGPGWVGGIMFGNHIGIFDAWQPRDGSGVRGNTRGGRPSNMRFYFTEKGWRLFGHKVIAAARSHGQRYRVIAVKETDAQIAWRDKHSNLEVALQPARRR